MTRLAFTLLLTWVSLCRSALAWEADKDVRLHRELSERHFNGVVLVAEGDGRTVVLHTGSTNGFLATCTFPTEENDTTVILLTNIVSDGFAELRTAVFDIVWTAP